MDRRALKNQICVIFKCTICLFLEFTARYMSECDYGFVD